MIDSSQLGPIEVALFGFLPMFVCALLLRAKGVVGILAIAGIIAVAGIMISDFEGWRLGTAAACAAVGLAIGGKISDNRERKRMVQVQDAERKKRDARLKSL